MYLECVGTEEGTECVSPGAAEFYSAWTRERRRWVTRGEGVVHIINIPHEAVKEMPVFRPF